MKLTAKLFRGKVASELDTTAKKLTSVLTDGGIPSLIIGGYALQEHGYVRNTLDVDVLVSSIDAAWQYLSIRGFKPSGSKTILYDRDTGIEVNLLPAGGQATRNSPLPLPSLPEVARPMQVIDLNGLIEMKLNVYLGNTSAYLKHKVDVMELIKYNDLSKESFKSSNSAIQNCWNQSWEEATQEVEKPDWES